MKLKSFTIGGNEVSLLGLRTLQIDGAINKIPNTFKATFLTSKVHLTSDITTMVGKPAIIYLTNGNATPADYCIFNGSVNQANPTAHTIEVQGVSDGFILSRIYENGNAWGSSYGNAKITSAMRYVIEASSTGLTQSLSAASTNSVTGFSTNSQDKTSLLRYLMQMSYSAAQGAPYVFYQSPTVSGALSANKIRCEPFGYNNGTTYTANVGVQMAGRPTWTNYSEEIINDITVYYNGGYYNLTDATSIATYGLRKSTYTNYCIDNATDADLIANTILWEWKNPKTTAVCDFLWSYLNDPAKDFPLLNKNFTVTDAMAKRTAVAMTSIAYSLKWPSGICRLTLGNIPFMFTDLLRDVVTRVRNGEIYATYPGAANTTLQNSHDAVANTNSVTPVKLKTITFTNGLPINYLVKFDMACTGSDTGYAQLYLNGTPLGPLLGTSNFAGYDTEPPAGTYITKRLAAGDALQLYAFNDTGGAKITYVKNFRVYYAGANFASTES